MSEYDAQSNATLNKWRRIQERNEDTHEAAKSQMKKFISEAMKKPENHRNMAVDLLNNKKAGSSPIREDAHGYAPIEGDEVITGFGDTPWRD